MVGEFGRAVRNLVDNAVEHARTQVALTVQSLGDEAELLVADDGPGIPPEHRERIFERFYRAEAARSPDGGNGLGLSIARGLAERNRGRVELAEADRGATLRLRLPATAS